MERSHPSHFQRGAGTGGSSRAMCFHKLLRVFSAVLQTSRPGCVDLEREKLGGELNK